MLRLCDQSGTFIRLIPNVEYTDLQLVRTLTDGDKKLSFTYRGKYTDLPLEGYIETAADRYVIKELTPRGEECECRCELDIEPLEAETVRQFTAKDKTTQQAANAALVGTGWTCEVDPEIAGKRRSVQQFSKTPYELLLKIRDAFMCEIRFDSKTKTVSFSPSFGSDRGVYLRPELNLIDVSLTMDSYDFYTRLIPVGENGLTIEAVNQGKAYVENYQYSSKVRTLYWEDTSYTDAQALKEDAIAKLADLSKPKRSYQVSVRDLAKLSLDYSVLDYDLGDSVTITDEVSGIRDKQRIVSITEYPDDPEKNSVELSNTTLSWEEYQARLAAAAAAWEEVSNADGSINGVYVHGVQAGDVVKVQVDVGGTITETNLNSAINKVQGDISAIDLRVGTVETTYLQATMANLDTANITTAKVKDLFVKVGLIRDAIIDGARITGYLDAVSINAASITAGTLVADRIAIRGDTNALVYALNNCGEITSQEVDTLDGYILTERTVNADRLVAKSITAGEIASHTITALEIMAHTITADEITTQNLVGTNGWINLASGTFAYGTDKLTWDGSTLSVSGTIRANAGNIAGFTLVRSAANNDTTANGGHCYGTSFYIHCSDSTYEYEVGMKGDSGAAGNLAFYIGRIAKGAAWSTNSKVFSVANNGALTATAGTIGGWSIGSTNLSVTNSDGDYVTLTNGSNTNKDVMVVRTGSSGSYSYPFHIHADGSFTATKATITGVITATSGTLGGWTLTGTSLSASANNSGTGNVQRWTGLQIPGNGAWAIAVGITDFGSWATAPFRVNHKGELVSTNATITGNITATSMTAKNTYYIHNSSGTKKAAMTAPDSSFGSSLDIGSGFSAVHLGGTNGVVTDGDIYVGGTGTGISLLGNGTANAITANAVTLNATNINMGDASNTGHITLWLRNKVKQGFLRMASDGNFGLYNNTGGKWVIYESKSGGVYTPQVFYSAGYDGTTQRVPIQSVSTSKARVGCVSAESGGMKVRGEWGATTFAAKTFAWSGSDVRIKTDIADCKLNALDAIMRIKVREFKKEGRFQPIGMIADELETIDPLLSIGGGYEDDGIMNLKSVDPFYLEGYLVKAIQELNKQLQELRSASCGI